MNSTIIIKPNSSINNPRIDFSNNLTSSFIDVLNNNFEFGTFTGNIRLLTNNTNRLTVINNGNVGIATTNPLYTLDVSGTGNFNGNIVCQGSFVGNLITAGVNWRTIYVGLDPMNGIAYGNGMFVVCNDGSGIYYSIDGINWTIGFYVGNSTQGKRICYGNGIFVIICLDFYTISQIQILQWRWIFVTTDAVNSTKIDLSSFSTKLTDICYGNNQFVIVCNSGTNRALTSLDGINWTVSATSTGFDNSWNSVCYGYGNGGGKFIAVAPGGNNTSNRSMISTDGYTWTLKATPANNSWQSVCYGNGKFVAVGSSGTNRVMTTDGSSNWTLVSTGETTETWNTICYGNGLFVAAAQEGNYKKMISRDAVNWTLLPLIIDGYTYEQYNSICYGNGMFIISRTYNISTQQALLSVSGYPTITTSPGTNTFYDNVYINKNITLYDNTSTTNKGNTGLQYKSASVSHIWSLVQNNSTNNLSFSSLYGYQFYTSSTNVSLSGTRSMIISTGGNVRIGNKTSLDVSSNLEVVGSTCINGSAILKTLGGNTISLNVGDETTDPTLYGLFQIKNKIEINLTKSTFSFINYTNNEYWQLGDIQTNHIGFFGNAGRYSSYFAISTVPCMTIHTSNFLGINKTIPTTHLDVSGNTRITGRTNMDGNLTCSSISVVNNNSFGNNIWFITNGVGNGNNATTPVGGNVGATGGGFGNVYLNGNATPTTTGMATYWNATLATFTAPQNGLYRFQLQVFDNSANLTTRGNCLQLRGNGLQFQDNGGQYLMFGQAYNASSGQYVITQTLYLLTGKIIYYANTSPSVGLTWFFGKGHTNLTITQLC